MKRIPRASLACIGLLIASAWGAATSYYDWSGPAFAGDVAGVDRSPAGDPDGDRLANAEEYAYLTNPLATNPSPLHIQTSNGILRIGFPWNNAADDLAWRLEHTPALVSNSWSTVSNMVVESTPAGNLDGVVVRPLDAPGSTGFFRLNTEVAGPELIVDALDGGMGWRPFQNALFADSSSGLLPVVGTGFFKHSVSANWSHSGLCKPTNLVLEEGRYFITISVGHDGSSRPFAAGSITLGFFDAASASSITRGQDIRDAVAAFSVLPGVSRIETSAPIPTNGWVQWNIEYVVAPGSAAIGKTVGFGIHAQSKGDGGNQALFDGLFISLAEFDGIHVQVADAVRTNLPPTLFNGHLVHHKAAISNAIWDCRTTGNTLRQGYTAQAFHDTKLRGVRYPGGTAAREWYDYDDQGGVAWLSSNGVSNTSTGTLDTVADVLEWCRDAALQSYFIVPVVRFWEGGQYAVASNYAAHAVSVTKAAADGLGAPMPEYWDIGNEIYEPEYDSAEYARFAGPIALAIKGIDSSLKPVVCVKRNNTAAAQKMVETLQSQPEWWNAVGGVTFHALNVSEQTWGGNGLYNQAMDIQALFPGKEFLVTALSPSDVSGLECANAVLGSYEQLIRAGAGHIVNWPVTHFNMSGRSWVDGAGLTPTGQVLAWLSESGVGGDMLRTTDSSGGMIKVLALREQDGKVVVHVAGISAGIGQQIKLSIGGIQGSLVRAVRLKAQNSNTSGSDVLVEEALTVSGSNPYLFVLNQETNYEIVRLEIAP